MLLGAMMLPFYTPFIKNFIFKTPVNFVSLEFVGSNNITLHYYLIDSRLFMSLV